MKVEVAVLGSPQSLTILKVSADVEAALEEEEPAFRAQELCESRGGGLPALPVINSPYSLCRRKAASNPSEVKSCVKVEVALLPILSLIVRLAPVSGSEATGSSRAV